MGDPAVVADGLEGLKRAGQVTFSLLQVPAGRWASPRLRNTTAMPRRSSSSPKIDRHSVSIAIAAGVSPLLRCTMASCRLAPGLPPAITKFPDAPVPRLD